MIRPRRECCTPRFDGGNAYVFRRTVASESDGGWRSVEIFKKRDVLSKLKAISLPSSRSAHQRNHPDSMLAFRFSAQLDILGKNCTARTLPRIQNRTSGSYRPEACGRLSAAISR